MYSYIHYDVLEHGYMHVYIYNIIVRITQEICVAQTSYK